MANSLKDGTERIVSMIIASLKPILVLIAGPTCSGKSYLASVLEKELIARHWASSVIKQDDYFKDLNDPSLPKDGIGRRIFDVPSSYRNALFAEHIKLLMRGSGIQSPEYEIATNSIMSEKGRFVSAAPVIIAEGLHVISSIGNCQCNTIKVYVNATEDICLKSKTERDVALLGVTPEMVERVFRERILPYQRKTMKLQEEMADIVIFNNVRR